MGLFKKRVDDPDEIQRLRAEIASMSQRLAASESAKQQLDEHVASLTQRIETPPPAPPAPTPPSSPGNGPVTTSDLDIIRARIERLAERVDQEVAHRPGDSELAARVEELSVRLDDVTLAESMRAFEQPGADVGGEPDEVKARLDDLTRRLDAMAAESVPTGETVDPEDFSSLQERVDQLVGRFDLRTPPPPPPTSPATIDRVDDDDRVTTTDLADLHERLDSLIDRVDQVDARMTSISTELANQITELGSELDRATAERPADAGDGAAVEELADELRNAQERLAAEQARYQIAFRQELAQLADRLRRGS